MNWNIIHIKNFYKILTSINNNKRSSLEYDQFKYKDYNSNDYQINGNKNLNSDLNYNYGLNGRSYLTQKNEIFYNKLLKNKDANENENNDANSVKEKQIDNDKIVKSIIF